MKPVTPLGKESPEEVRHPSSLQEAPSPLAPCAEIEISLGFLGGKDPELRVRGRG
jgi:hypothetical protein